MDPLSIAASCLALIGAAAKTTSLISRFVHGFLDARHDLSALSRQLEELQLILGLLCDENDKGVRTEPAPIPRDHGGRPVPGTIKSQICAILLNCAEVLTQLDSILSKYMESRITSAIWAVKGKAKVAGLEKQLDTHIRALNIALELSQLASTRAVREDTSFLRQESSQIKQDTAAICTQLDAVRDGNLQIMDQIRQLRRHSPAGDGMEDNQDCWRPTAITPDGVAQILEEIARLRELLPSNVTMNASKHEGLDSATSFILERYLESASLYAETIREDGNSDRGLPMRVYPSQDEVAVGTPVIGTAECQQQGENVVSPTPSLTTSVQPAESLPRLVFAKRTNGKPFFTNRIGNDGWAVAIAEFMKEPPTTTLRFYGLEGDGQMPKGATRPKWQSPLVFRFVNVSRHGERVAFWTRGKNSACRVLDRVSGKCISLELSDKLGRGIPEIPEWFVSCPTFSPDGKMIAAFLTDTRSSPASDWILIWTIDDTAFNLGAVTQTAAIRIYLPDSILSDDHLAISPDGQRVVMHRRYSRQHKFHTKFHIWDIYSGGYGQRRCQTIDMGSLWHQFGKHPVFSATDSRDWMAVTWNPLTQELSFCNLSMGSTFTWSVPLTRQAPTTPTRPDVEKGTCVDSVSHQQVALAYDGNSNCFLVAVVVAKPDDRYGSQQGIRVWNLTRSELVCEVKIPPRSVALRPDLSDDGKFLAATIFDKEGPRHGEGRVIAWKIQ